MAYLFKVEGKIVQPNTETLLISPFKEIWERDQSPGKEVALQEFTYIEFMTSMLKTNPYKGYASDVKHKVVSDAVINVDGWQPDEFIMKGMEFIFKQQKEASPTYTLYMSTLQAKEKLERFFRTVDLDERSIKTGLPIYKPKELSSAMLDVDKLTTTLAMLARKVEEELFDDIKTRGQKEISPFADPSSLIAK